MSYQPQPTIEPGKYKQVPTNDRAVIDLLQRIWEELKKIEIHLKIITEEEGELE